MDKEKVLACVDRSRFADAVADSAAWAAARLQAPLELLHVIDRHPPLQDAQDHSGAIGIDAQEKLLQRLSEEDAARSRAAREEGRLFLNRLRERALAAGAPAADVRLRHGGLGETLQELEGGVGLFVLGRRGASAQATRRDLGRNIEWTVRSVQRPVLAVTEAFRPPRRVLVAFDGARTTRRGIDMLSASPLLRGLPIHLLMSGRAQAQGPRMVEAACQVLQQAGFAATSSISPGDPETVIAHAIQDAGHDLLVMGAYSHSPLRSLLLGSRTTDLLRAATVPTLLLR